ncbi:MAG TPA: hypothetical protein PKD68_03840 [Candidatus Saccharibacteria bacterium]|nr:hypothetical protein [Candidatus Saccharibacteria bacterium]
MGFFDDLVGNFTDGVVKAIDDLEQLAETSEEKLTKAANVVEKTSETVDANMKKVVTGTEASAKKAMDIVSRPISRKIVPPKR